MKRFQFRFESVLGMKKLAEEIIQSQLASIQIQVRETERLKEECLENIADTQQMLLTELKNKIPMYQLNTYVNYLGALRQAVSNHGNHIKDLEEEIIVTRERLIQATQDKKIFENLKNREHQKYLSWISREDQKFLDEITVTHHNRKK